MVVYRDGWGGMVSPAPQGTAGRRLGQWMMLAMWGLVLVGLTYFFNGWLERQLNPNQQLASRPTDAGGAEVILERNRYGHYVASGRINHHEVVFLLDTGATDISIPAAVARRIGLRHGAAHKAVTANGVIEVHATRLDSVELGAIVLEDVRASINPYMGGGEILLGMSFLRQLDFSQTGDRLTLRQR